jgi:hypothetical protein
LQHSGRPKQEGKGVNIIYIDNPEENATKLVYCPYKTTSSLKRENARKKNSMPYSTKVPQVI